MHISEVIYAKSLVSCYDTHFNLSSRISGEVCVGFIQKSMSGQHVSTNVLSGKAMAGKSIAGYNVPSCIQPGIDTSENWLSLTMTRGLAML